MQDLWIETLTKILLSTDITVLPLEGFQDVCSKKSGKTLWDLTVLFCLLRSHIKKTLQGICLAQKCVSQGEHVIYEESILGEPILYIRTGTLGTLGNEKQQMRYH